MNEYEAARYKRSYNLIEDKDDVIKLRKRSQKVAELAKNHHDIKWKSDDMDGPFVKKSKEPWDIERKSMKQEAREKGFLSKLLDNGEYDFIRKHDNNELAEEVIKVAKRAKSGLKLVGKALPIVGAGMALTAPSADAAVAEMMGVESMGVSPEQMDLDKQYKQRIRSRQEALNLLPH